MTKKPQEPRVPRRLIQQINSIDVLFEDHIEDLTAFVETNAYRQMGADNVSVQVFHYAVLKLGYEAELFEQHPWGMLPSQEPYAKKDTLIVLDFGNDPPEIAHFHIKTFICGLLGYMREDLSGSKESLEEIYLDSYIQGRETRARVLERMCAETLESDSESIDLTLLIHTYCMEAGYDIAPFPNKTIFVKDLGREKTRRDLKDFGADICFRAWAAGFLELPFKADDIFLSYGDSQSQDYVESYEKGIQFRKRVLEEN